MKRLALVLFVMVAAALVARCASTIGSAPAPGWGWKKSAWRCPTSSRHRPMPTSASLVKVFDDTLWNDLSQAGIFDVVSKSFYPLQVPGAPEEMKLDAWANPPTNASMVAFGNLNASTGDVVVQGWLYDVKNSQSPQVLGKQYRRKGDRRERAHHRAPLCRRDHLPPGRRHPGHRREQDRFRQQPERAQGNLGDGLRRREPAPVDAPGLDRAVAAHFAGWFARRLQRHDRRRVEHRHVLARPRPHWCPFRSSAAPTCRRPGRPTENRSPSPRRAPAIRKFSSADADGAHLRRVTAYKGPDVSPVWNPKTGAQIAWVSGRTGLPQIYTMEADGTNLQRMTDQGYAVSPSWSPNGQFLAFAWIRHYGPGDAGSAGHLRHGHRQQADCAVDARGRTQRFSRRGRRTGGTSCFSRTAPAATRSGPCWPTAREQHRLTSAGQNTQPNWSWK